MATKTSVWTQTSTPDGILKVMPQIGGRKSFSKDFYRNARPPGKRISKNGKVYYENRANRSDIPGKKI